jgi:hypothetical protein
VDKFWYALSLFLTFITPPTLILAGIKVFDDANNQFLLNFINHEYLNTIGFMMTVIVASLIQVSLSLNSIEEKRNKKIFKNTRILLNRHLATVVILFLLSVALVLIKPYVESGRSYINGICVSIVVVYALSLLDVGRTALGIPSIINE